MIKSNSPLFILLIPICLMTIEVEKISEFAISEVYNASENSMQLRENYLFAVNSRSFQIFNVSEGSLNLVQEMNLEGDLRRITLCNNYAYVSTLPITSRLYRINISDLSSPVITDTITYLGNYVHFADNNHIFVHEFSSTDGSFIIHIYDNETFEELTIFEIPEVLWPMKYIKNGVGTVKDYTNLHLYDLTDIYNITEIHSFLLPNGNTTSHYKVRIVQDEYLFINTLDGIEIYSLVSQNQLELLNTISGNNLYYEVDSAKMVVVEENNLWLYNLINPGNPELIDSVINNPYLNWYNNLQFNEGHLSLTTIQGKLFLYSTTDNTLQQIDTNYSYGRLHNAHLHNEHVYIATYLNGITNFDLGNIFSPQYTNNTHQNFTWLNMTGDNDIIIPGGIDTEYNTFKNVIMSVNSDEFNVLYTQESTSEYTYFIYYFDEVGYFKIAESTLYKYQIDENNNLIETAQVDLPETYNAGSIFFNGNCAYIIYSGYIAIIENINNANISFSNEISIPDESSDIYFYNNYMFVCNQYLGDSYIYNIEDPINPELMLTIENSGFIGIDQDNELLFMGYFFCEIYDLSTIHSGVINQIGMFQNWSHCEEIIPFKRDNENYIIYLEDTSCSIYHYDDISNSNEQQILTLKSNVFNHPNPFSGETTISFSLTTESTKNAELIIYNIKGQIVDQLTVTEGDNSHCRLQWNASGQASGIYLYKLVVDGKDVDTKKMILLK